MYIRVWRHCRHTYFHNINCAKRALLASLPLSCSPIALNFGDEIKTSTAQSFRGRYDSSAHSFQNRFVVVRACVFFVSVAISGWWCCFVFFVVMLVLLQKFMVDIKVGVKCECRLECSSCSVALLFRHCWIDTERYRKWKAASEIETTARLPALNNFLHLSFIRSVH